MVILFAGPVSWIGEHFDIKRVELASATMDWLKSRRLFIVGGPLSFVRRLHCSCTQDILEVFCFLSPSLHVAFCFGIAVVYI